MLQFIKNNSPFAFFLLFLLLAVLLYLPEIFIYPGFVQKHIALIPSVAFLPSLNILLFLRLKKRVPESFVKIGYVLTSLLLFLAVFFSFVDLIKHPNYIFSTLHVHWTAVMNLAAIFSLFALVLFNLKLRPIFQFVTPFWILGLSYIFKLQYEQIFIELTKEDALVEYLTMIAYLIITFIALSSLNIIRNTKNLRSYIRWWYIIVFAIIGLGSFIVAGEEISWAQRIVGFATPEKIAEQNTQGEFNIHNNGLVFGLVYYAYGLIALYGATAFLIHKFLARLIPVGWIKKFLTLFTPAPQITGFFLIMAVFIALRFYFGETYEINKWEEYIELFLATGIFIFILMTYRTLKKQSKSLSKLLS